MKTHRSEEDSDNPAEERSAKADKNAVRTSRGGSWARQHRSVGNWNRSLRDGRGNDGRVATNGDERLGGVRWRRGDGDEGRASRVGGDGRGVGNGNAWNAGVIGDDDGIAARGDIGYNRNGEGSDRCGSRSDGWRSGVADGAWTVQKGKLVDIGEVGERVRLLVMVSVVASVTV